MESRVRIKATIEEMSELLKTSETILLKLYEPVETLPDNFPTNQPTVFNAVVRHKEIAKPLPKRLYTPKTLERAILSAPTTKPTVKILRVISYTVPMYGNKHMFPYAKLRIQDGNGVIKVVNTQEADGEVFIKVNGFKYTVKNNGTLHEPSLELVA